MKTCNTCKKEKPLTEFGINKQTGGSNFHTGSIKRYCSDCRPCLALKQKAWRKKNPNYWKKVNNKVHTGLVTKYPKEDRYLLSAIRSRVSNARQNSKRNPQREFNIDANYLYNIFKKQSGKCALTGIELFVGKNHAYSLSLDKIVPELGYTQGNVQWLCWAINRAKGDLTTNEFINMCKTVIQKSVETIEKKTDNLTK